MKIISAISEIANGIAKKYPALASLWDKLHRNAIWILLVYIPISFVKPNLEFLKNLFVIVILGGMAIGLSGISVYAYTALNFIKHGYDLTPMEKLGRYIVIAAIFYGMCHLVGSSWSIVQFSDK